MGEWIAWASGIVLFGLVCGTAGWALCDCKWQEERTDGR